MADPDNQNTTIPVALMAARDRLPGQQPRMEEVQLMPGGFIKVFGKFFWPEGTWLPLSEAATGLAIKVVATASAGTAIHTAVNEPGFKDEIHLYAYNTDTTDRKLTIEFGGLSSVEFTEEVTVPAEAGSFCIIKGRLLSSGLLVKAFCATANVVCIHGKIRRFQ